MKLILSLFMVSLLGCCHLSAQQQSLFYYYKGKPISLPVNSQHFLVYADASKISKDLFAKEYRVTEWIEDGSDGVLEAQVNIPNGNYEGALKNLKEQEYVIDIEPVIGDSVLTNTSRLLYDYIESFGTSMAAPHVSGVAGLIFSINPELTSEEVRDIIEQTVNKDLSINYLFDSLSTNGSWEPEVGYGLLDAHRAVLDLNALEQWHTAAKPIADPYSLMETRFMEGYAEIFAENAETDAEMANYADFHALKLALRNIDVVETQNFASLQQGDNGNDTLTKRAAANIADNDALTVYPNPTADLLHIELRGAGIAKAVLYDLQGRVVETFHETSLQDATAILNVCSVPAGVYVLRVTDADGKEYHQKIVKK